MTLSVYLVCTVFNAAVCFALFQERARHVTDDVIGVEDEWLAAMQRAHEQVDANMGGEEQVGICTSSIFNW